MDNIGQAVQAGIGGVITPYLAKEGNLLFLLFEGRLGERAVIWAEEVKAYETALAVEGYATDFTVVEDFPGDSDKPRFWFDWDDRNETAIRERYLEAGLPYKPDNRTRYRVIDEADFGNDWLESYLEGEGYVSDNLLESTFLDKEDLCYLLRKAPNPTDKGTYTDLCVLNTAEVVEAVQDYANNLDPDEPLEKDELLYLLEGVLTLLNGEVGSELRERNQLG